MHVLVIALVALVVGGALGFLFGGKVETAAEAEISTVTTDAKAAVTKEVSKL